MRKIICIAGETASGKDTLTDMVSWETGIPKVVSYTDAPKRTDQTEGKEHYFLTPEQFDRVLEEQTVIAYTKIGKTGYRYCATLESLKADKVLYIIDPAGIHDLKSKHLPDTEIKVAYIYTPLEVRRRRASVRGNFNFDERVRNEEAQFEDFHKNREADTVIYNFGDISEAEKMLASFVEGGK